jgi:hypothetical protein
MTLALSIASATIIIVVTAASVLTSGIFERKMRMLAPTPASEIFETNINNEVKSLKDATQKIENRMELLSSLPQEAAVGTEIEKLKDLVGELNLREKKLEEIILQNPSKGSAISKPSRTRSSRARHRKA